MSKPTLEHLIKLYTSKKENIFSVAGMLNFWNYFIDVKSAKEFLENYKTIEIPPTTIHWFKATDNLPEIPAGKFGVGVFVVSYDHVYEELCPGKGKDLEVCSYGAPLKHSNKKIFYTLESVNDPRDYHPLEIGDRVLYWAYIPDVNNLPHD